jgi:hypothetical protein
MRYGALLAMVGALVLARGVSADDKTEKPVVKKEAPAKDAKSEQPVKKPTADAPPKKPTADAPPKKPISPEDKPKVKEGEPQTTGKLEAASVAGNVLTLTINGQDYEIPMAMTKAMVKAGEQGGKQVVFAVQLVNVGASDGKGPSQKAKPGSDKPDAPKKPAADKTDAPKKPAADKTDAPKKPDEKAPVKTPEKKP